MKKHLALLGMAAMFSELSNYGEERKLSDQEIQHRLKDLEDKKEAKQEELKLKKGLTKFWFNDNSLWALNYNSAKKKARKKGWIN